MGTEEQCKHHIRLFGNVVARTLFPRGGGNRDIDAAPTAATAFCGIRDPPPYDPDPTGGENNVAWSGDNNSFGFSVNDRSVTYPPRMDAGVDKDYVVKAPDGDESAFRRITQGDGKCMFNALLIVDAFRKGETVTSEQVVQRTRALKAESSEPGEGGWGDPPGCRLGARWGARSPHSPEDGDKEVAQ
eukprot:jgi/Mesvir1/29740/Mv05713-RA.1